MGTDQQASTAEQLSERIFDAVLGMIDSLSIYVGDKFGLYEALAERGPLRRQELCDMTGMHVRYADEWLEQQVTTGLLMVDDPYAEPEHRVYELPVGHAEVLTDHDSLNFLTPFVRLVVAGAIRLPDLMEAYSTGGGVSWQQFGPDMRTGQAEMNRPWFINELGTSWFPSVESLHDRLVAGARVADVGCGEGWSSIAMAQAYPETEVVGFDIDAPSIDAARSHATAAGLDDRVSFELIDASDLKSGERFDVVTAFECIHDMPDPVSVLASIRNKVHPDGWVVVMDEGVADRFGDSFDEVERLMYGFSLFVCLPDGMSHSGSVGTGTVIRPSVLERYAMSAGFSRVEVLPIENDLWRFYRLHL